jgi:hypothetical protein
MPTNEAPIHAETDQGYLASMRTRIMYIENKSGGLTGACRIGRVGFSKTGSTLFYDGRSFKSLKGAGFKANWFDEATGDQFWISGPRKDGADGLYGRVTQPEDVDADVAEAYWRDIRGWRAVPAASGIGFGGPVSGPAPADLPKGRAQARIARALAPAAADDEA